MKKAIILTIIFLISILATSPLVQASVTNVPYHISGMVKNENGDNVTGATVIIESLRTGETNLNRADGTPKTLTSTPSKESIITNNNGLYYFLLSNLNDYEDNDKFKITAKKGDRSGSTIITIDIDVPPGYDDADVTIKRPFLDFNLIILIIIICIIIILVYGIRIH